jgi:HAD superfamily hydrolase (TIGR01450 family)
MRFNFDRYAAVLLDLDGTIFHDNHALPGAVELLKRLDGEGKKYACLTNNTTSPKALSERLGTMGIRVTADHIYTAGAAAVDYALEKFSPRPRVFNLANAGVQEMLEGKATIVLNSSEACDAIVVGTPGGDYATPERQRLAMELARRGSLLIGTSTDRVYPSPRGLEIAAGALTQMLAYAASATPVFTGKPQALFFEELGPKLHVKPGDCVLIGDNIESDLAGAKGQAMHCVMTLTGVCTREELGKLSAEQRPDFIVNDLTELL